MILKHRDTEVLRFEWIEPEGVRIVSVNEAARRFLPLDLHGQATDGGLWRWLRHRAVPKHRAYIAQFLSRLGIRNGDLRGILGFSRGLSLNDVHWVAEDDDKSLWKSINLYANPFSETLAYMAFTGGDGTVAMGSTSPELTTNGMLAKCWRRLDGTPVLFKGGTEGAANSGFEPYSEFYAAQVAEAIGLDHVPYGLSKFKGRLCSTCAAFTSDRYGYLSAGRYMTREAALSDSRFADIFFFDALICNPDRHLGNFGYLVDNDTNEIVRAAPIFDNGYGLFSLALYKNKYKDEFADLAGFAAARTPALYYPWLNIPGGITARMKSLALKLRGFRFRRHAHYNLPTERLRILEDFLQRRISEIAEYDSGNLEKSQIASHGCTIKTKNERTDCTINRQLDGEFADRVKLNLKADPFITMDELANILRVSRRTVSNELKRLSDSNQIQRVGSRKTGYWKVIL